MPLLVCAGLFCVWGMARNNMRNNIKAKSTLFRCIVPTGWFCSMCDFEVWWELCKVYKICGEISTFRSDKFYLEYRQWDSKFNKRD